jgi:hypothetical protein
MSPAFNLEDDVKKAQGKYPLLAFHSPNFIKGTIELVSQGIKLHDFQVEMKLPEMFPYCYPLVTETGGDIERIEDRHVYTNSSHLCLGVQADEIILCRFGQGLTWFLDKILTPRLAEEYLVMHDENYVKEYSHGWEGPWEYYQKRFGTNDRKLIVDLFEITLSNNLPNGLELCPCGSKRKFSKCHRKFIYSIQSEMRQTNKSFWIGELKNLQFFLNSVNNSKTNLDSP